MIENLGQSFPKDWIQTVGTICPISCHSEWSFTICQLNFADANPITIHTIPSNARGAAKAHVVYAPMASIMKHITIPNPSVQNATQHASVVFIAAPKLSSFLFGGGGDLGVEISTLLIDLPYQGIPVYMPKHFSARIVLKRSPDCDGNTNRNI